MSFTKAYGKYFDGHTSKPYEVELEIWPEKKISFFYNNRKLNWNFEEVSFEKNSDTLYITRKENHAESLRIDNPYVINLIYQSAKKSRNISWYQNILDLGFKFYAEININNSKLWDLVKSLSEEMPDKIAVIFGHEGTELNFGKYSNKTETLNFLSKFK